MKKEEKFTETTTQNPSESRSKDLERQKKELQEKEKEQKSQEKKDNKK